MPSPSPWRHALAATCCAASSLVNAGTVSVLVQDDAGQPLADAVVQLLSPAAAKAARSGQTAAIAQRDKAFQPGVTVIQTGTSVDFPNQDTVRHHVYSFSPAKRFELKLYSGTPATPVLFDKPGLVVLGCNIHDQMVAWVHVVDTPYHGKTDAQGRLTLPDVPKGGYRLQAWHQRLPAQSPGAQQSVQVGDGVQQVKVSITGLQAR